MNHLFFCPALPLLWLFRLLAPPPLVCLLCVSSQGLTRHDAVDQITETGGKWHQHYHSWLCGARRIHQRCHYPQLSPGWWWWWCHLRACRGCRGAQSPALLPAAGSMLSLFSLWHLFQEGSCPAPFTLFRAIVKWEIKWKRGLGKDKLELVETTQDFGWSTERIRFCLFPILGHQNVFSREKFVFLTSHAVQITALSTDVTYSFNAHHSIKGNSSVLIIHHS